MKALTILAIIGLIVYALAIFTSKAIIKFMDWIDDQD